MHPNPSLRQITVRAPRRGKLGLVFDFIDGRALSVAATPATIRQVMKEHGEQVTTEQLAAVAFCGQRYVVSLGGAGTTVDYPAKRPPLFQMTREGQRFLFALSGMWLGCLATAKPGAPVFPAG